MNSKIGVTLNRESYFESCCKYDQFSLDWLRGTIDLPDVGQLLSLFDELGFHFHNWCIHEKGFHWYNSVLTYCGNRDITISWNCVERYPFNIVGQDPVHHYYVNKKGQDGEAGKVFCFSFDCNKGCRFFPSLDIVPYNNELNLNSGIQIEVTGDGLRFLREMGLYSKFLDVLRQVPFRPTRLDFAFDIFDKDNPFVPLCLSALYNRCTNSLIEGKPYINTRKQVRTYSKSGKCTPNLVTYTHAYDYLDESRIIQNIIFGKHGSDSGMFRLYDKFLETGLYMDKFRPDDCVLDYWYRFEYETKGTLATSCWEAFCSDHYNAALGFNVAAEQMFTVIDVINCYDNVSMQETNSLWHSFLDWCSIIQNQYCTYFERSRTPNEREAKIRYFTNMAKTSFGFLCLLSQLDDLDRLRSIEQVTKKFIFDRSSQLFLNIDIDPFAYDFLVSRFYDIIEDFSVELNNFRVIALREVN